MTEQALFELIFSALSGEAARKTACAFRPYPLKLGFSSYAAGIRFLAEQYRAIGLDTEIIEFPADGVTTYADRHFPLAWDVDAGFVRTDTEVLADYAEDTYGIIPFSASSNGEQHGMAVPFEKLPEGTLAGIVPLFGHYPKPAEIQDIIRRGAKAFMACVNPNPIHGSLENSRRWFNDLFGAGQIDARHKTVCGYSITPASCRRLLKRYDESGAIPVTYRMDTRTYAGTAPCVTATIPGEDDRCFFVTAHAYEPHATNDIAGVSCVLEAARTLKKLIDDGKLPKPKHTIRFFHGLEVFSLYAYAMRNRELMRNAVGGISVDSLGRLAIGDYRERFVLWRETRVAQSEQQDTVLDFLKMASAASGIDYYLKTGSSNNEDLMQDPGFGPPWALLYGSLWSEPGAQPQNRYFYHTNTDTPDELSPVCLKAAAAVAASQSFWVANHDFPVQYAKTPDVPENGAYRSELERKADRMIVTRKIPGPMGAGTIAPELAAEATAAMGYPLEEYWVLDDPGTNFYLLDGKRSLFEAAAVFGMERLPMYMRIVRLLEHAGEAEIRMRSIVERGDIVDGLRRLGLKAGDTVMVHSGLSWFGKVLGGADTVIDALLEVMTEDGIVAMPAFSDCSVGSANPPYDPKKSPVEPWVGKIPEVFRNRRGVQRSAHPTHSVCAYGKNAAEFLAQEGDLYDCFAPTGPWGKLAQNGGKLLFLGESIGGNTFLHMTEARYTDYLQTVQARTGEKTVTVTNYPGGARNGWYKLRRNAPYWKKLVAAGLAQETIVGDARLTLIDAGKLDCFMKELFSREPDILLRRPE